MITFGGFLGGGGGAERRGTGCSQQQTAARCSIAEMAVSSASGGVSAGRSGLCHQSRLGLGPDDVTDGGAAGGGGFCGSPLAQLGGRSGPGGFRPGAGILWLQIRGVLPNLQTSGLIERLGTVLQLGRPNPAPFAFFWRFSVANRPKSGQK